MALIYDNTFAAYTGLSSTPYYPYLTISYAGYASATVTAAAVKFNISSSGTWTFTIKVLRPDDVYSDAATVTGSYASGAHEIAFTWGAAQTAKIDTFDRIRVQLVATDGIHIGYVWYDSTSAGPWLQLTGILNEEETGVTKATEPSPDDESGPGIDFATRTLSWTGNGGATNYTVRIGTGGVASNVYSYRQEGTSYIIPEDDISLFTNAVIAWRIDSDDGGDPVTGDTWTFDPRPAKVTTPSPADDATGQTLNLATLSWAASTYADSYMVYPSWGSVSISTETNSLTLASYTPVYLDRIKYSTTYTWIVDAVNEWGTTEGDTWTFTTEALDYSRPVYYYSGIGWYSLIWDYGTSTWGDPPPTGTIDVDYEVVPFINFIASHRRLVAASADSIWYESST